MTVKPKTFLVGVTQPDPQGIGKYLEHTKQEGFWETWNQGARDVTPQLCLVSMFAKLCYKSLVLGKNENISKTRGVVENLKAVLESGHGSVFEHVWLNFITTDCSRVFTHELVRHRVGTAFSQTSGRYVSIDELPMVLPPDLEGSGLAAEIVEKLAADLRSLRGQLIQEGMDFATKKRITSAIRRLAPNGQANEIAWSINVRALRHVLELRTNRAAEWEMRFVFDEVSRIVAERWPLMLSGGTKEIVDGLAEWKGLRV